MNFVVFNQISEPSYKIDNQFSNFIAALESFNENIFFVNQFDQPWVLQDIKDYILTTRYGMIFGYLNELEHRTSVLKFVKKLNLHILLELPDYIYIDINNFLPFEDTLFIGINDKVNSDAGTFLFRRLVLKRNLFKNVIGIRCPDSDLIDVFRIVRFDDKTFLFMNQNFVTRDALLFNGKEATFFDVKKLKSKKKFIEIKPEESTLKHLRFFLCGKNVLLFDDAFRLKAFFEEHKFNLFLMDSSFRNQNLFPNNIFREFY